MTRTHQYILAGVVIVGAWQLGAFVGKVLQLWFGTGGSLLAWFGLAAFGLVYVNGRKS